MHQPPPIVIGLGTKDQFTTLVADAAAQNLAGLGQTLVVLRHIGHAFEDVEPINHRMGGPLVGRDGDAVEHLGLGLAVAREGFDGREFAHVQILARAPTIALDAAFHKRNQTALQGGTRFVTERKNTIQAGCLMRRRQQVGAQGIAAPVGLAVTLREVVRQSVSIQITGQLCHHRLPGLGVAQAKRLARLLLHTREGVIGKPVPHAGQTLRQSRLQHHLQPAATWQCVCRGIHVQAEGTVNLRQRGLLHSQRHGGDDALLRFEAIARSAELVLGVDFPQDGLEARESQLRGRGHIPRCLAGFSGRNVQGLGRELQERGAWGHHDLHGLLGGVAQGELGAELIVLAHQRRQPADDLQILGGPDAGGTRAKQTGTRIGNRYDFEAGQGVIQRHVQGGATTGIELNARVPQQQRIEQLTRSAAATTATGRNGFAAEVPATDDFHVRGRSLHAPGPALQHRLQQVPAVIGHQLQQGLVHRSQGDFGIRRRPAIG